MISVATADQNGVKSGFISIIGRTNSGKSTLLNYLLGENIAMTSHKQNATRRQQNAIVMYENNQLIFIDTPGLHESDKLINKLMVQNAIKSMGDADILLFCASVFDDLSDYEKFLSLNRPAPHIIALTKIDLASQKQLFAKLNEYQKYANEFIAIVPVSVKKRAYRDILLAEIAKNLPTHPYFYDPEDLTTANERQIAAGFIMQAIFESLSDEIPYSSDAAIKSYKSGDGVSKIAADIICANAHHKAIIIGKKGEAVKRIGIIARKLIAAFTQQKIHLDLNVKVDKNWHTNEEKIKKNYDY